MSTMFQRKVDIPETRVDGYVEDLPQHASTKGEHHHETIQEPNREFNASLPTTPRSPLPPLTPLSVASSATDGAEPNMERGMVLHQQEKNPNGMALVTVRSMSNEERNRLAHLEISRKMQAAEAVHSQEAEVYVEKTMRDALAEMYHAEARAEKKFEEEMSSIKYKEAQLKRKIENKLTQAMAEKTRQEILARQKFEERKLRAKTLADEKIATAKVRGSAIRSGSVRAELVSTRKKLNWRW